MTDGTGTDPGTDRYISTVMLNGYERYAVRLNGALMCVMDVPSGQGAYVRGLARRWLSGDVLPDQVKIWVPCHG